MTAPEETNPKQKLLIDMITFTFPIDINKRELIRDRLNDPQFHKQYKRRVYSKKYKDRYNNNYDFSLYNGTKVKLAIYPINKSHNFLRVEYSPNNLKRNGRRELRF